MKKYERILKSQVQCDFMGDSCSFDQLRDREDGDPCGSRFRDAEIYEAYGQRVNPAYPLFLKNLGIERTAVRAEGAVITGSDGTRYIDCVGGYGLANVGHNHPRVLRALREQLDACSLASKPLITEWPVRLAECLAEITPGGLECSFLCNSGSEAIDTALKLARLHQRGKTIIAARNSFHGFTFGALSVSGVDSFRRLFEPLVPGVTFVPFGDLEALRQAAGEDTAAVLLEIVQHEAGVYLPPEGYFAEVRKLCDERGILLIIDEIKTGFGKTGAFFACEGQGIAPDILVLGKSMGGGLIPVGAVVASSRIWKRFGLSFPMSASSYAGNVLACRAALATVDVLREEGLLADCPGKGRLLLDGLARHAAAYPEVVESVSGIGLLIGLQVRRPRKAADLARALIRRGILAVPAFGNPSVLMIEPPLVITREQIGRVLDGVREGCEEIRKMGDSL